MSESSRMGWARGRMIVATAAVTLAAMMVLAAAAAAAADPIASGTTNLTINKGFNKRAKKAGIKVTALKPTKLKGRQATLRVNGGEIAAGTGIGTIAHGGGLKFKLGKKSAAVRGIKLNTKTRSLTAKVAGKKVKLAKLAGVKIARVGFGDRVAAKKLKLTGAGAKALNKKLTPAPIRVKAKRKGKTVVKVVRFKAPFKANMVLGKTVTEVEPETVGVLPTGAMTFAGDPGVLGKLAKAEVKLEVIAPTAPTGLTTFVSPLSGGTISPLGTSGQINSGGGLKLVQNLTLSALGQQADTSITLGSVGVDLGAKTAGVEVIGESTFVEPGSNPKKQPLNLGNLGRSSIADLAYTAISSPATRTVTVTATGTIQVVATEVLNGFVKVHQIKATEDKTKAAFEKLVGEGKTPEEAKAPAEKQGAEEAAAEAKALEIKAGETLGSFSFVATGE